MLIEFLLLLAAEAELAIVAQQVDQVPTPQVQVVRPTVDLLLQEEHKVLVDHHRAAFIQVLH